MPETWTEYLAMLMTALAAGYAVYEIDRRRRRLHDVWDVLGGEDAELTEQLVAMVSTGELRPYTGAALA
jgi:hypothetical protein